MDLELILGHIYMETFLTENTNACFVYTKTVKTRTRVFQFENAVQSGNI